jgi:hypothetical protein
LDAGQNKGLEKHFNGKPIIFSKIIFFTCNIQALSKAKKKKKKNTGTKSFLRNK